MIKAVLFDLDNTLYDQKSYIYQGFEKTAEKILKDFPGHIEKTYLLNKMIDIGQVVEIGSYRKRKGGIHEEAYRGRIRMNLRHL